MNKFLSVCFQVGKWFLAVVLLCILFTAVYLIGNITNKSVKMSNIPLEYKFQEYRGDVPITEINKQKEIRDDISKLYKEQIDKILKENNAPAKTANLIIDKMVNVEEQDRADFVNNLSAYYKDLSKYIIDDLKARYPKITESDIKEVFKDEKILESAIPEKYFLRYTEQSELRAEQQQKLETERSADLIALLVCLCMFVTFLIVPILIRIEENTRH